MRMTLNQMLVELDGFKVRGASRWGQHNDPHRSLYLPVPCRVDVACIRWGYWAGTAVASYRAADVTGCLTRAQPMDKCHTQGRGVVAESNGPRRYSA
jgi:hypothetical protein